MTPGGRSQPGGRPHGGAPEGERSPPPPPSPSSPSSPASIGTPDPAHDARCRVLARLVPPLVHRLNNHLMVVVAALETAAAGVVLAHPELAKQEAGRIRELLARLATFAAPHAPGPVTLDLAACLAGIELLLRPLAESGDVVLEVRSALASAPAAGEARLEQALVAVLGEILARAATPRGSRRAAGAPRPRLRVTLSGQPGRIRLAWALDGTAAAAGPLDRALDEVLAAAGARARRRSLGRAHGVLLALRGTPVPHPEPSAAVPGVGRAGGGRGSSILLVEPAADLGDLVEIVLADAGHRVRVARDAAEARRLLAQPWDIVLVDTDVEREAPGFLEEAAGLAGAGARLALLESRPERAAARAHALLAKPFRPGQLVEFVRALRR